MRRRVSALALGLVLGAACDNSDLTSEYGKSPASGGSTSAAGSSSGPGGSGGATGPGAGGMAKGGGASTGGGGAGGSAGSVAGAGGKGGGIGGHAGTSGESGSAGAAGHAGSTGAGGAAGGSGGAPVGPGGAASGGKSGAGGGAAGSGGSPVGMGMGGAPAGGSPGAGGMGGLAGASVGGAGGAGAGGTGPSVCGNGITEPGEECDEGTGIPANGCYPTCTQSVDFTNGSYTEVMGDILSPERGYLDDVDLTNPTDYSYIRNNGNTVADAAVLLDAFKTGPISDPFLATLAKGLDSVRTSGIKVMLHFLYNNMAGGTDAPLATILGHIGQLSDLFKNYADVIAVMEAGFIGEYGAWYNSTNGLANATDEGMVLNALLAALPPTRSVAVRTPMQKDAIFPGGPLTQNPHDGSPPTRTGHYDDCFVSSDNDMGTYDVPYSKWEDYVAKDTAFVPMMGQVCASFPPRSDCPSAQAELSAHHFSLISGYYDETVIAAWKSQGCYDTIRSLLGYRLVITSGSYATQTPPGGALGVRFHMQNHGYSPPFNGRPFQIVLTSGATRLVADVPSVDVRSFAAGQGQVFDLWFRLPSSLAEGSYQVRLLMPDASPSIASIGAYAIRLANNGIFDTVHGDNTIGTVTVSAGAPGGIDPSATVFAYLKP